MQAFKQPNNSFLQQMPAFLCILISGVCWYLSNGLNGSYWYLLWLAPVPVLLVSFKRSASASFYISFIAYAIGRLSWFSYLARIVSVIPAIVFIIVLALIFALIVHITRRIVIKTNAWYAVFAFPVFFTVFEYLLIKFSPDGTAASIAYSQSDFLPIIQVAAITGILGISFTVTFIPAALALGWKFRQQKNKLVPLATVSCTLIFSTFFGKDQNHRQY
jgi:apolipoprotein N-acyltransferase